MRIYATALLLSIPCVSAFIPPTSKLPFGVLSSQRSSCLNQKPCTLHMADTKKPFFATEEPSSSQTPPPSEEEDDETMEEEVERLVSEEVTKGKRVSRLANERGIEYAPWMGISPEDEEEIRKVMKEKAVARRARIAEMKKVSGNLYYDSQAQELSGTGLKSKVIDANSVELEWGTKVEENTKGFIVKRRPAKTEDFDVIASFVDYGPLVSKGPEGGIYRYLDEGITPGGWVYRVTECDQNDKENDLCQCLVEVETEEEQEGARIAAIGIGVFAVIAVLAGLLLDPNGGF